MAKEKKGVRLEHISKIYQDPKTKKDFYAVHDTSLDIQPGSFVTLLGPSGCGKTTTLRMIAGFESPDEGEIYLGGEPINALTPNKRDTAMVFQSYALLPHYNIFDNVAYGLKLRKMDKETIRKKVLEILELVGLEGMEERMTNQLSGGQQQRVAIARALVTDPAIICMDEPLSNLDAKLRVQLRNELKKMQKDFGITTIYVTHDQEEALTLSDRIAVFNKGYIEQIGTPNEIYNHSATEFVCNFIGDINRLEPAVVDQLNAGGARLDRNAHNYIRLERIHVNTAPKEGDVVLQGRVEAMEYYGLYIKYYIDLGSQTIKVIEKNDGVNIYEAGQTVSAVLNPRDVMSYPGDGQ